MIQTLEWTDNGVRFLDQTKLPTEEIYVNCTTYQEVADVIRNMVVRGAPAIGVAAGMGVALGVKNSTAENVAELKHDLDQICDVIGKTRPTAVNLFWAIDRMKDAFAAGVAAGESVDQLKERLVREAAQIHDEDVASCRAIGAHGAEVVPSDAHILTHCNAGALATAGYGTALGVIRGATERGKKVAVFADETRPFLQGARLTAWELVKDGIDTTVITESMAAPLMRDGRIDLVVVGADRIAANGDTANKVGTYTVALVAREHKVPFYVAAPVSTIDLKTSEGRLIPIEERNAREVTHVKNVRLAPEGAKVYNPAFDVTPHGLITGIITERGIARAPYTESLAALVGRSVV
jgi:methylthioribose-1-phosphate isomerase